MQITNKAWWTFSGVGIGIILIAFTLCLPVVRHYMEYANIKNGMGPDEVNNLFKSSAVYTKYLNESNGISKLYCVQSPFHRLISLFGDLVGRDMKYHAIIIVRRDNFIVSDKQFMVFAKY
jgi:hypothetical protein